MRAGCLGLYSIDRCHNLLPRLDDGGAVGQEEQTVGRGAGLQDGVPLCKILERREKEISSEAEYLLRARVEHLRKHLALLVALLKTALRGDRLRPLPE